MPQIEDTIYFHGSQLNVDHTPGAAVAAGELINMGNGLIGVATAAIVANRKGALALTGIFKIKKDAIDTFAVGVKVSWDDTANQAEPDGGPNEAFKIGVVVGAAAAADNFVLVMLNNVKPLAGNQIANAVLVVGAEAANIINVTIQLKDASGVDLAIRGSVFCYLSDDANGDTIAAVAPSGGIAIGTDGLAIPVVANKAFELVSEADGDIDLDITEALIDTWFLIVVLPDGTLVASAAITFA